MKKVLPTEALEYFRSQGARGGKRSLETMTPEERSARAKKASEAAAKARSAKAATRRAAVAVELVKSKRLLAAKPKATKE